MVDTPLCCLSYPVEGDTDWYDDLESWLEGIELLGIPTYETFGDLPAAGSQSTITSGGRDQAQFAAVVADATVYRDDGSEWVAWMGGGGGGLTVRDLYHVSQAMLVRGGYFGATYPGVTAVTDNITGSVSSEADEIEVISSPGSSPYGIAVDPSDGTLWHTDSNEETVYHLERDGTEITSFSSPGTNPNGISVDPSDGMLWHVDYDSTEIYHLERDGTEITSFSSPKADPRGIAVDPADGTLWHANEIGGASFFHLERSGTEIASFDSGPDPFGISVDPSNGTLWSNVFDMFGGGSILSNDTRQLSGITNINPTNDYRGVSIDPIDGTLWCVDTTDNDIVHIARHSTGDIVTVEDYDFVLPPRNTSPRLPPERNIWVIDNGASDPVNALDRDIIMERES